MTQPDQLDRHVRRLNLRQALTAATYVPLGVLLTIVGARLVGGLARLLLDEFLIDGYPSEVPGYIALAFLVAMIIETWRLWRSERVFVPGESSTDWGRLASRSDPYSARAYANFATFYLFIGELLHLPSRIIVTGLRA